MSDPRGRDHRCLRFARLALLLPGLVVCAPYLAAQSHNFHHYDTDDGLVQVQVLAVHQDRTGYIWAGSYGGLSRYAGHSFYSYTTEDGLGDNVVESIADDVDGRLWAGTSSGLCYHQPETDRFECLETGDLATAQVYALHAGTEGLWAGTDRGLFLVVDGDIEAHYLDSGLPSNDIRSITHDHQGTLWVGTTGGLARFNRLENRFSPLGLPAVAGRTISALLAEPDRLLIGTDLGLYEYSDNAVDRPDGMAPEMHEAQIADLTLDADSNLWAATNLGLLWRRHGDFQLLTTANGLTYDIIFSVTTDRDGLVWFGHDGGLSRWIPTAFVGYRTEHGLIDSFVRTINQDHLDRLWLGTRSGLQVVPYQDGGWRFNQASNITRQDGLIDERVYSVTFPEPDEALIATGHGVARWREDEGVVQIYTDAHGLPVNQTQALLTDRAGQIWIGTNQGTVTLRDNVIYPVDDLELAQAYVYRFREDDAGRVWAVARTGLYIVDPDGRTRILRAAEGLSDATLWDLHPDHQGGMWIGSNGDGLFHVDADGAIRQYTTEDGLVDNFIWQVLVDERDHVWGFTNRGLSRFDGTRFHNYNRYDGLLHQEGGATGAWQSHDGNLWFASADGLMRYDPRLSYPLPTPPQTVIDRIDLDGEPIAPGQELPFSPGTLDFHYAAMSFRAVSDLRYRYRMKGISDSWSEPITYRPITFGSLGSGAYEFEVQARNPGVDWDDSPIAGFAFTIKSAYWETVWFWSLVVLMLGATMLLLIRWQARRGELRRLELEDLVRQRTAELEKANEQLKAASITDPLTGLHNRRFLMNQINKDVAQALRAYASDSVYPNRDILFMMCDLDHFKKINDQHGHLVGDFILRSFAELILNQLRESDYLVRWGGEEFLIVARQTEASRCQVIANRILEAARAARFQPNEYSDPLTCTCSIGISHLPFVKDRPDALNWEQVIDIADSAVYMAKDRGRNGWVSIHGTENSQLDDSTTFLNRIKTDIEQLIAEGQVRVINHDDELPE